MICSICNSPRSDSLFYFLYNYKDSNKSSCYFCHNCYLPFKNEIYDIRVIPFPNNIIPIYSSHPNYVILEKISVNNKYLFVCNNCSEIGSVFSGITIHENKNICSKCSEKNILSNGITK